MRLMSDEEPEPGEVGFTSVVSMSVQPSPLKPQLPVDGGWWGRRRGEEEKISLRTSIPSLRRREERTRLQVTADGDGVSGSLGFNAGKRGGYVRDGGGKRTVGGVVAPGGEDVPALDESGLHMGQHGEDSSAPCRNLPFRSRSC